MKKEALLLLTSTVFLSGSDYTLEIEIPELDVAEYHNPYLAVWIENNNNEHISDVSVWYKTKKGKHSGTKWLKDLRSWWRKSGRDLDLPIDGLSNPTKRPGKHSISLNKVLDTFRDQAAGDYKIMVEAVREVGGREVVSVPFKWDGKSLKSNNPTVQGKSEITAITLK